LLPVLAENKNSGCKPCKHNDPRSSILDPLFGGTLFALYQARRNGSKAASVESPN
jgi:hypothetical protein